MWAQLLYLHFIIRQEVLPVCLSFHLSVLCRSCAAHRSVRSIYKNTAYAFVHTGVWHNPRKQKQKQYIPKYALTDCQLFPFISCQTYVCTDWFVSIIYVRCGVATELSADNSSQRNCTFALAKVLHFFEICKFFFVFLKNLSFART